MIEVVVKSTLLLALTGVAAYLLRRQSAALVHRIWVAGLIAAVSVPLLSRWLPNWPLPVALGSPSIPVPAADSTLADALLWIWLIGATIGLGIMVAGTVRLGWLVLSAEPIGDRRWITIAGELAQRLALRRPVQLLRSSNTRFLGTWGVWRPRILVPAAAHDWSDRRIRAALAHELGHVARADWPVQVLAEAARAIYWFNPLFWLLVRRLRQESEHAADNLALGLDIDRASYARELLEISAFLGASARQGPILAVAQPSFLERRLRAVLNPGLRRVAATPWATVVIMLLAVVISLPLIGARNATTGSTEPPALLPATGPGDASIAGAPAAAEEASCPVTPTVEERPPDSTLAAAFGEGPWHVNDDRSIWVWAQTYVEQTSVSAIWIRPEGARLQVAAERLDAVSEPVTATFDCCFPQMFKTGGLRFPAAGCWRVEAMAGERRLTFVTRVAGRQ